MEMIQVGQTVTGEPLWGYTENNIRKYFLEGNLVAVATGNLEETAFTQYYCVGGIWDPDAQTMVVERRVLNQLS